MNDPMGKMRQQIMDGGYDPLAPMRGEKVVQHNPAQMFLQPQQFPMAGPGEPQQVAPAPMQEEPMDLRSVLAKPPARRSMQGMMDGVEEHIRQLRNRFSR